MAYWLKNHSPFHSVYAVKQVSNFEHIFHQIDLPDALFEETDLFIYQPIADRHGTYATNAILKKLPSGCQTISFPYIFNDGLWPLFKNGDKMVNQEPIVALFQEKISLPEVMRRFVRQQIDFKIEQRFEASLNILREKERETDLKGAAYISDQIRHKRLFLTHNHPSTHLIVFYTNQVLHRLGLPLIEHPEQYPINAAGLPGCYPLSPYERKKLNLSYHKDSYCYPKKKLKRWKYIQLGHILEIYTQVTGQYVGKYPKLVRSISKYQL